MQDKIRGTTTDNCSNFVKAFVHFGEESAVVRLLAEKGPVVMPAEEEPAGLVELLEDPEDAEELPGAVEVYEVLEQASATSTYEVCCTYI